MSEQASMIWCFVERPRVNIKQCIIVRGVGMLQKGFGRFRFLQGSDYEADGAISITLQPSACKLHVTVWPVLGLKI